MNDRQTDMRCSRARLLRLPLVTALLVGVLPLTVRAERSDDRPNVVILFVDQLRWSEVGCYGNAVVRTPHLDKLASESCRFTLAFTNFPSCSPARSTLLSGRYARSNGVYANQDRESSLARPTNRDPTLAETLAAAGYTTAIIGKWHLTPSPETLGFQTGWTGGSGGPGNGYMQGSWKGVGGRDGDHAYEGYTLEHQSELAEGFLRKQRDRPFLLYLAPTPPHMPIASLPDRYKKMYEPGQMPLRPNVWKDGKLPFDERWFSIYLEAIPSAKLPPDIDLRDLYALYYGQVAGVDDWVGRVLKTLHDLQLDNNTIVLFSSDHGDLLGSHHLFNKNSHYDESCRVPLIVRWPRRIKPVVQDRQIISQVDVMPTLLDLCGVKAPATVQGTSLAPVLLGRASTVGENVAYIETTANEGVRTTRHVYWCDRRRFDREHLFDVDEDPYEMNDLVRDPAQTGVLQDLRARTKAWRERTPSVQPADEPAPSRPARPASRSST
ncbi:MAG: sulfatase-like hydrolase/transferase [Planctomycetes bacterium]|nr:sulfatase-like hydrolase/transferase [Planctomycetota bacterium]